MNQNQTATLTVGKNSKTYPLGTPYLEAAKDLGANSENPIALVLENGRTRELFAPITTDAEVSFLTLGTKEGANAYVRTASFIFIKAVKDVFGIEAKLSIEFSVGDAYYCPFKSNMALTPDILACVKRRMNEIITSAINIKKKNYSLRKARVIFEAQHMEDKVKLCSYRRTSSINLYEIDGYFDYFYGYMLPNTSYISAFDLELYAGGFLLFLPNSKNPCKLAPFKMRHNLFRIMLKACEWGDRMGIRNVCDLNDIICTGGWNDLVLVQEALQEHSIGEIADDIASQDGVKFILIAGPSSSGKTTFSHRLCTQLRTHGLKPYPIAADNYYLDVDKIPLDENGDKNFEALNAIDLDGINSDMMKLLSGEGVLLPRFNFIEGKREYKDDYLELGLEDVLVIEGIHCLNDKFLEQLPPQSKYKIYVSALATLNVDEHNRIPTTDVRLLRRMVRDARTRGNSAVETLSMWKSVRRGEEENIFPFQENVNAMFNTGLIYEISVLKHYAEPLLFNVSLGHPQHEEARRLLKLLDYFLGVSEADLPKSSIIREFVGGSCFKV